MTATPNLPPGAYWVNPDAPEEGYDFPLERTFTVGQSALIEAYNRAQRTRLAAAHAVRCAEMELARARDALAEAQSAEDALTEILKAAHEEETR